jgi:3-oxoacyl-[acyl-carrier-protein] synthase-1
MDAGLSWPLQIAGCGAITAVGTSAVSTCAAIRGNLSNASDTRFVDEDGEWLLGHSAPVRAPSQGVERVALLAAAALRDCMEDMGQLECAGCPLVLCLAEMTRPGRIEGLNSGLRMRIEQLLSMPFAAGSRTLAFGRAGGALAFMHAATFLRDRSVPGVFIVGTDTLLNWPTLRAFLAGDRLLTRRNSNGFVPGEAAAAIFVTRARGRSPQGLRVFGLGFGLETGHLESELPQRADGLCTAVRQALTLAGSSFSDVDLRISDVSGEHYYFKEAALLPLRLLRTTRPALDLWHPAECVGEIGSASVPLMVCVAELGMRKRYLGGQTVLLHTANDLGERAALVLRGRADGE